jgi:cobalt-zinc-cadmium resistance protein CzcA
MNALIRFALSQRALVVLLAALLAVVGIISFQQLPIDAVPDITNVQVQINTQVKALAPAEIEKLVTFPVETTVSGVPGVTELRSLTKYGLSQVTVVFTDGTDIYWARQRISERLTEARERLPQGVQPVLGPISTGLGEIFHYAVEGEGQSLTELRTLQDWMIKPQLRGVPGVAEVNSIGGYEKQYHVTPDPVQLASYGLTFRDVFEALEANNANAGGAYIEHSGEQYLVRGVGLAQSVADLESIVLTTKRGTPVYVRDVAEVGVGEELRTGAATQGGQETVYGLAMMLTGENSRAVSIRVREKLQQIQQTLPAGVTIKPLYDRSVLVNQTIRTVQSNLLEGGVLVIAVLLLLLGQVRAALIVASAIPLSMLFAVIGMVQSKISGNLMSLGAIDFGLIVDGAVVMAENIVRRLGQHQHKLGRPLNREERRHVLTEATLEMGQPVTFAVAIIMIVYLPILTLQGVEGKMFRPMAATVLLALGGALVLTLTFVPALCSLAMRGKVAERENWLMRLVKRAYAPTLRLALRWRWPTVGGAVAVVAVALWLFTRLGAVFVPQLDEGSIDIRPYRLPSISLTESLRMQEHLEKAVLEFPEVETVFSRIGTAEVASDPMGVNTGDVFVMLKPRGEWRTARTKDELIEKMQERLAKLPGQNTVFTQPIQDRFDELIAGVRADVAIKVFGDDLDTLRRVGQRIADVLGTVRGAQDVLFEQVGGLPMLEMQVDRQAIARYGVNVADVLDLIETAIGGKEAGQLFEGERRFAIIVRLPEPLRQQMDELKQLAVKTPSGALIPLAQLSRIDVVEGLNQINRERGRRRAAVQCNVRGRDIDSFIREVQARIAAEVQPKVPAGYAIEYGGQFENLQAARRRLAIVVPVALGLIFFLLFSAFKSLRQAMLIFTGVPLAVTGGVFALVLRDLPFSISAAVGFIALSGVAVLNGVVMVSYINRLREEGKPIAAAVTEGALTRLRPVLMTALVASLGFVPMAIATGTGAEVQRPLATVVIGGLISSTLLTLVVLPVLYRWFEPETAMRSNHPA